MRIKIALFLLLSEKKINEIGELLNDIEDDDLSEDVILENSSSLSSKLKKVVKNLKIR